MVGDQERRVENASLKLRVIVSTGLWNCRLKDLRG